MKYILNRTFSKLPALDKNTHPKVKIFDDATLLKGISIEQFETVKKLTKKNIDKVILPKEIYRVLGNHKYEGLCDTLCPYAYTQEYALNFRTLNKFYCWEQNYSNKEILEFYRNLLSTLAIIHKNGVWSGDIWVDNILMDESLDYRFIDFDFGYVKDVPIENEFWMPLFLNNYDDKYLNSNFNYYDKLEISDKMSLWNMILYSMLYGNFSKVRDVEPIRVLRRLQFPLAIEQEFIKFMTCKEAPETGDYLLNELDTLIEKKYELPYRRF